MSRTSSSIFFYNADVERLVCQMDRPLPQDSQERVPARRRITKQLSCLTYFAQFSGHGPVKRCETLTASAGVGELRKKLQQNALI